MEKCEKKQPSSTQQIQESFGEQGEDHTQSWPVAWGSLQASSKLLTKGQGLEVAGQVHSPQTLGRGSTSWRQSVKSGIPLQSQHL